MTEQWQELKETIKELRYSNGNLTQQEVCSFLGVYMETLEKQMQESTYAKGTIIKSALKYLVKMQIEEGSVGFAVDNDHDHDCCWDDVLAWIEAQSSEEDFVKHKKEAYLKGYDYGVKDWFKSKTQPCEDTVSRGVLTEYINTKLTSNEEWASDATNEGRWVEEKTYLYGVEILEDLDEYVKTMPSVTPKYTDEEIDKIQEVEQAYVDKMVELAVKETKRPKGHWIIIDDCELFMAKCSECGEIVDSRMINKYPYCHCGAEMRGEENV